MYFKSFKMHLLLFTTGYSTHIVGKWHLGFFSWPYTPLHRGFDSFYGMYLGCGDHYKHKRSGILDLHDNKSPVKNKDGVYSMNLFAEVWNNTRFLFIYSSFCLFHLPFLKKRNVIVFIAKNLQVTRLVEPKILGSFSNDDGNGKDNRQYSTCGSLHVHHAFL